MGDPPMQTATLSSGFVAEAADRQEKRRRAISGAVFSEFIDMFDIYLPTVVLSPVLFLLGRPIGALAFGVVADRLGRRMASITSVAGFGIITFLIALIPGYHQIGIASYWLLVILRFLDGICLGGGYTGAHPLAIEYSKKDQRGFTGGLILSAFPAAYIAITLVAMLMFAIFPLAGEESAYAQWGWRIPFVIGALLAGLLVLYYVFMVSESEIWETDVERKREKTPLSDLVSGPSGRNLLQVLVMMTGFWLTQNIITIFIPTTLLLHMLKLPKYALTSTLLISYAALFFSYIASGMIGQRIGRRRFFVIAGPLIAVIGSAILYYLIFTPGLSLGAIMALVCVLSILVTSPWGVIITYINERFVTDVRATGFGIGFSLSVILPSFYPFYMNWLGAIMPFRAHAGLLTGDRRDHRHDRGRDGSRNKGRGLPLRPDSEAHPAAKLRGAGLITLAPSSAISMTAKPRSLVPSARKRKTPSAPLKPDMLVSAAWLNGSAPPLWASAAASVTAS
jgi:predicted MFS family arabinose efflux permease